MRDELAFAEGGTKDEVTEGMSSVSLRETSPAFVKVAIWFRHEKDLSKASEDEPGFSRQIPS